MPDDNIDSTNIFDEFSWDQSLKDEIAEAEKQRSKDMYFYMWKWNAFLYAINIIFFIWMICSFWYIYIQNNEEMFNAWYLDPVCKFLIGDARYEEDHCSSVTASTKSIEDNYNRIWQEYYTKISEMLWDVYYVSSFALSKEVMFLLDKNENRLAPIDILIEFDWLKNSFEPVNKAKINCGNIKMKNDGMIEMKCETFSSRWDRNIIGVSWSTEEKIKAKWTSISIASSFINYIEKNSKNLLIVEKPKKFSYDEVVDFWWFTRKTTFKLWMALKNSNIWLLQ